MSRDENIQAVFDLKAGYTLGLADIEILKRVARMALAAMDSEPVAWTWHYREQWHVTNDKFRAEFVAKDGDVAVLPLYRHAQPSIVPGAIPVSRDIDAGYLSGWNDCRAATLQAKSLTGNSPVIGIDLASGPDRTVEVRYVAPPGYVMVPKEPTEEMLQASYREASVYSPTAYRAMIAAAPQEAINALIPLVSRNEQEVK
ncbi:hypothetical protein N5M43_003749 [Klebsiella pneumoniae]|nr:hypothetical protein [Klebsiella pneumoniae]EKW0454118.1 hypothetical protein [Klebsiella pneumoniae]EKW3307357.1 hypothetical protein [Klebsiella pneumoniae]EKX0203082.1 hypothetical protein [Klebsiella pneumoniae]ELB4094694.1 hypothetical protein [Klebsiella pneumoniae]